MTVQEQLLAPVLRRLDKIETMIAELMRRRTAKAWYTTDEIAEILGKAKFTVREWCRHGRIRAEKQNNGRGRYQAWVISHDELLRIQRDGLLPRPRVSTTIG